LTDKAKQLVPDSLDGFEMVLNLSYEDIQYLLGVNGLLDQFQQVYSIAKKERNELDFADLEHYATLLLDDSLPVKEELYHRFKEIMIDEYQDTNQIQENMVMAISEYQTPHIPLFMVGDMKQSIYRFRQADPTIFKTKYRTFKTDSDAPLRRIDLHHNYRSHKRVLDSINYIFDQIMDENVGDLEYYRDPSALLNDDPNAHQKSIETLAREPDHETEILINVYDNQQTDYDKNELEAHMVAQHIQSLVQKTNYDYKDIAILMATSSNFVTYKKIFNRYNIPTVITLSEGLFESNEVKALMSLLKVLVNPYDNIAMLSVLHAPFVFTHFDENTILSLRNADESIYDNCLKVDDERIQNALNIISDLSQMKFSCSPYEILMKCLEVTEFQSYVSTLLNGEQRSANIDMLLELFHKNDRYPYLQEYLDVLEADASASPGMIVDDDNNAVNFMTIHKSKGLEFSVVYVCNLNHQFSNLDIQSKILLDAHLGVSMDARVIRSVGPYDDVNCQFHNPYRSLMAQAIVRDNRSEYMRLLYVALTRAANKLVLTGSVNELEHIDEIFEATTLNEEDPSVDASDSVIYNLNLRETNNFLDWILIATARHPDMFPLHSLVGSMPRYSKKLFNDLRTPATQLAQFAFTIHQTKDIIDLIPDYQHTASANRYDEVHHLYDYQYPYEDQLRSIAVTTLQAIEDEQRDLIINVDGPRRENALTLGTNVHELLSHFGFKDDDPQLLLETLTEQGLFTQEDHDMLVDYMPHLLDFVNSDTYRQIAQAQKVMKEKPFRYKSNGQIINGIFDLVFMTDDMIYVLDYKTDHITNNNSLENLKEKHRLQLDYYSDVLRHYYHRDVTGMVYY
ncbi:MAG: UvrD-helicase domain-containing protein, partial [Erysipelotrichaceae bacterium]|nr:UvrD-helicase domain-containing protein [Erysipelotrichaceae bacterium]